MKNFSSRFSFLSWLILVNGLLIGIIGLRYFHWMPWPESTLGWSYFFTTLPSHYWLISLIGILPLFFVAILPVPRLLVLVSSIALSLFSTLLLIDTFVFDQYRFHISYFVIDLMLSDTDGQVITFSWDMWALLLAGLLICFFVAILFCLAIIRFLVGRKSRYLHLVFLTLLLASHFLHALSDANSIHDVTSQARFYPLMHATTAQRFMLKYDLVDKEKLKNSRVNLTTNTGDLIYPKSMLQCEKLEQPKNILVVVIDSWRADAISKEITPSIFNLAKKNAITFNKHFSGSNSTRGGIFSLFYGVPPTYWHSFLNNGIPSPLITELQNQRYDMGVFASAQLRKPEFDRTVFASINNLRTESQGGSSSERDINLTDDWLAWLAEQQTNNVAEPFFGFLFYDAPHGYDYPANYPEVFQPVWEKVNYFQLNSDFEPTPFVNRYLNSVHFVDSQIERVIKDLKLKGLLDNTLVVITGDHGQEFNDLNMNYWGHNSNFSTWQLGVPFILYDSNFSKESVGATTTHYDVLPTLFENYLGCTNSLSDYSVGRDILNFDKESEKPWFIAASYSDYAFISDNRIVTVDDFGRSIVRDNNYQPLAKEGFPSWVLQAMKALSFYFKDEE